LRYDFFECFFNLVFVLVKESTFMPLSKLLVDKVLGDYKLAYFDYRQKALPRLPGVFAVFDNVGKTLQVGKTSNLASYFARPEKVNTLRKYGATKIFYFPVEGAGEKGSSAHDELHYRLDKLKVSFPDQIVAKSKKKGSLSLVADSVTRLGSSDKTELLEGYLQLKALSKGLLSVLEEQRDIVSALVEDLGGVYENEVLRLSNRKLSTFKHSSEVEKLEEQVASLKERITRLKKVEELNGVAVAVRQSIVPVVTELRTSDQNLEAVKQLTDKVNKTIQEFASW
jgi:hypothetical protein